ncbi:MAG: DNA polymerase I [Bacilli bacterium]
MKKLILVDGNSIMFRAYYATAYTGNVMKTSDNLYTNAIYGFVNMMNKILTIEDVTNIFVAFDKGKQTFRHQAYKEYKGGRKPMPEEFSMQIPFIKEYLDILKIKRLETDDYEADDLIGTIAKRFAKTFDEIVIISGDKDLLQLVGNNVKVFLNKKGITDLEEYNETNFKDLMGFEAKQLTDYKGLIGDKSDNLPGISGVGDKTAIKLLNEYQTLENIIANVDKIKGKLSQTIKEEKEIALRTKMLATLELDAKIDIIEEETLLKKPNLMELRNFFEKLEFNSFLEKINFQTLDEKIVEEKLNIDEKKEYYFNDLSKTLDALNHAKTIVIEVELDGENYHKSSIIGLGIIVNQIGFYLDKRYLDNDELKSLLSSDLIVYTIDAKKTYVSLKYLGIDLKHIAFDVVLSAYVVNPSYITSDIKSIVERFIQTKLPYFEEIYGKKTTYVIPDEKTVATYALDKGSLVLRLKEVIDKKLKENHQIDLFYNIELPLAKILGLVEMNGFKVNENKLKEVGDYFNTLMKKIEKEIFDLIGYSFNVASPKQLGVVLFEDLQLGHGKKNKTGYSTSAEVLEELSKRHPVPRLVLEYRKYAKLYSTYVLGLLAEINQKDGKVHTIFKQSLTQTGRLSSTEPNIQNIPIRTEEGRIIRSIFIPSNDNNYLVSADYSQIELRILASASNCLAMKETFNNDIDLHANTAAKIYNVNLEQVTKEMRRMAKAVNFGIIYGMSDWGLSGELHISPKEANLFSQKYFEVFPEVKPYLDNCIKETKERGYTTTFYNRRRYMPEINSPNAALRKFSERASMNAPIQGTAADIMKIAMIQVQNKFEQAQLSSKIVAQVHDELIIDCPQEELEIVKNLVKKTMETAVDIGVKLDVDVEVGKTWDLK